MFYAFKIMKAQGISVDVSEKQCASNFLLSWQQSQVDTNWPINLSMREGTETSVEVEHHYTLFRNSM